MQFQMNTLTEYSEKRLLVVTVYSSTMKLLSSEGEEPINVHLCPGGLTKTWVGIGLLFSLCNFTCCHENSCRIQENQVIFIWGLVLEEPE